MSLPPVQLIQQARTGTHPLAAVREMCHKVPSGGCRRSSQNSGAFFLRRACLDVVMFP